jgi:hypothetical protein
MLHDVVAGHLEALLLAELVSLGNHFGAELMSDDADHDALPQMVTGLDRFSHLEVNQKPRASLSTIGKPRRRFGWAI